jgi:MFS family permease
MALAADIPATDPAAVKRNERRASGVAFGAHALHDGYTDLIYVMLPIWQAEFSLGYAALGMLRGLFSGSMAGLQIPAGMLAERLGPAVVLAAGTALAGLGFCLAGASTGLAMLMVALALGGIGSSTQHPLGSELIARTYAGTRSLKALGAYNFSGDVGKMTVPALAALMITVMPWQATMATIGAAGIAAAAAILLLMPRAAAVHVPAAPSASQPAAGDVPPPSTFPFWNLVSIGVLDSATRMAFLTFLPFVLTTKGASLPTVGLALTLVFAGGAAGKLVCAFIGARIGVIGTVWLTEALTAVTIVLLLPLIGVALNGTSSVLYGSVPFLVAPERRSRAFGIFYTGTIGSGAIAPVIFGFAGDAFGVSVALCLVAATSLATLPLALLLRPALAQHA